MSLFPNGAARCAAPAPGQTHWALRSAQAAFLALACYRGFRAPNLWSVNYWQVSWLDGFFRRGLLGTLLYPLGCTRFDPRFVWILQFAVLALALGGLLWLGRRGVAALLLVLFLASDAGTFLFHEVGYPEQLLLLLTLACWALLQRGWTFASGLILALALLVHEMALFTVAPALLVFLLRLPAQRRPALWRAALAPALALAGLLALSAPLPPALLERYAAQAAACGHPIVRLDFLVYYEQTLGQNLQAYFHLSEFAGVILPLALALAAWVLWGGALPDSHRAERWAVVLASLCPLLLGFMGTDKNRWVFLVLLQLLLLLGTADGTTGRRLAHPAGSARIRHAALGVLFVATVLLTHIRLFDHFEPRILDWPGVSGFMPEAIRQLKELPGQ